MSEAISLQILVCDGNQVTNTSLTSVLRSKQLVREVKSVQSLQDAKRVTEAGGINTIFIDPITLGLDEAGEFILNIRRRHPNIVFVLYIDVAQAEANSAQVYQGTRSRLSRYYKLDKKTPIRAFSAEVDASLAACVQYLQWQLPKRDALSLKQETPERTLAEVKAEREAAARAKREAEAKAKARREAEAKAQREAEAKARREAEAKTQREAEAKTQREAEAKARREAEAKTQREAEAKARREAEAKTQEPRIFLSYRRKDTQWVARSLYESLSAKYGHERVFRDIDSTPAGVKYSTWIESRVSQCSVMIVLIGNAWLSEKVGSRPRLEEAKDWVRQEIEAALRRDIPIIPVLVQGARLPSDEELPDSVAGLTGYQSAELTDSRWDYDVSMLLRAIDRLIVSARTNDS